MHFVFYVVYFLLLGGVVVGLADLWSAGSTPGRHAVRCSLGQAVHTCASVTKQYNLVPAQAGKLTVDLASHRPWITDNSGISTYGLTPLELSWAPRLCWSRSRATFTFYFFAGVTLIMLIILCFSLCFVGCRFWFDCTSASDGLERFVSEMTYSVSMGLLNRTHSLVIASFIQKSGFICCSVFSSCPPLSWYVTVESAR